jgi:hypothetical protein
MLATGVPTLLSLLSDLRTTIHLTALCMNRSNRLGSLLICRCPTAIRPSLPRVVVTRRDMQESTQHTNGKRAATGGNHGIPRGVSLEKKIAASFKKSCSRLTRANSRLSRATPSSRGTPCPRNAFSPSRSRHHRLNTLAWTPQSLATYVREKSAPVTICMASCFNSLENLLRFVMTHLLVQYEPFRMCPQNRGKTNAE